MKNIVLLTSHDLNARDYGSVLRVRNVAKMLSRHGEVRVILGSRHWDVLRNASPCQAGFEMIQKIPFWEWYSLPARIWASLKPNFADMENYRATPADSEKVKTAIEGHDLVWVHGLETANAFGIWRWPRSVLDVDDIPSGVYRLRLSQSNSLRQKCFNWLRMVLWQRSEKRLGGRFNAICVCSAPDREKLRRKGAFVLPNGFELPGTEPARNPTNPPRVGFVGTFVYWANCEGARWFIDNVWPLVRIHYPQAILRLAGERGDQLFKGPNIETLGWVRDMEAEMASWSLMIVPVLAGGGTRIKILEAFSRKCPVVSTSIGCYGYDLEHERELLVADQPKDFAAACLRLLKSPVDGSRMADSAWQRFSTEWTWTAQAGRVAEIIAEASETEKPRKAPGAESWNFVTRTLST